MKIANQRVRKFSPYAELQSGDFGLFSRSFHFDFPHGEFVEKPPGLRGLRNRGKSRRIQ